MRVALAEGDGNGDPSPEEPQQNDGAEEEGDAMLCSCGRTAVVVAGVCLAVICTTKHILYWSPAGTFLYIQNQHSIG